MQVPLFHLVSQHFKFKFYLVILSMVSYLVVLKRKRFLSFPQKTKIKQKWASFRENSQNFVLRKILFSQKFSRKILVYAKVFAKSFVYLKFSHKFFAKTWKQSFHFKVNFWRKVTTKILHFNVNVSACLLCMFHVSFVLKHYPDSTIQLGTSTIKRQSHLFWNRTWIC
jgi:hypothetical protein